MNIGYLYLQDKVNDSYNWRVLDRHRHIHEVPTDAFGDISFDGLGQKTGKYARVSTDTSPEILYQLLTEQWKLSPPNLLISVTGGAKNFYLKARIKNMFHRGLIKVAQTTGAWIITGGTHAGVMKHVGQAVRDNALSMATWGIIHNKDALVRPETVPSNQRSVCICKVLMILLECSSFVDALVQSHTVQ
uniref:Transient receptor potential cation channel, subfamily M, member 2 n=1 Tax=Labrus bergylta TaxID=56723 RepID=A0A3Q3FVU7_9LABR